MLVDMGFLDAGSKILLTVACSRSLAAIHGHVSTIPPSTFRNSFIKEVKGQDKRGKWLG